MQVLAGSDRFDHASELHSGPGHYLPPLVGLDFSVPSIRDNARFRVNLNRRHVQSKSVSKASAVRNFMEDDRLPDDKGFKYRLRPKSNEDQKQAKIPT